MQRLGRSGHRVGAASRAVLFPLHGRDLVDAAVLARCVIDGDIEESAPVDPAARRARPGHRLDDHRADLARRAAVRRAARQPPLQHPAPTAVRPGAAHARGTLRGHPAARAGAPAWPSTRSAGTVHARAGAARRLYANGGTIPDRGYYKPARGRLRSAPGRAGRGVRLRAPGRRRLRVRHAGVAHPAHRQPGRRGRARREGRGHVAVLEGRGGQPAAAPGAARGRRARAVERTAGRPVAAAASW